MKIRNHKKIEYIFFPYEESELKGSFNFKYKSDLIRFLMKDIKNSIKGIVILNKSGFGGYQSVQEWIVWSNDYKEDKEPLKIVLKQSNFKGCKHTYKSNPISKKSKKYFAFSEKVISLMGNIGDDGITKARANKLVLLFKKRGFKDFEPTDDDLDYINNHIERGIDFFHWSDRCNWLRTKTIIEYFKRENLLK
jgi:hypothetical protein